MTSRTYDHYCMLARALEQVGDRWTLLVVRDLLGGPRRFTDLMNLLGGITPTTLSQRLRELHEAGIVDVDRRPGRREVWYRLTPAGEELAPAVRALLLWGLRHARRPRAVGEAVHPEHLLNALRVVLSQAPPPSRPLIWHFCFVDDGAYALGFDGDTWALVGRVDDTEPDVTVTTTADACARFLTTQEAPEPAELVIEGRTREVGRFRRHLDHFRGHVRAGPPAAPPVGPAVPQA